MQETVNEDSIPFNQIEETVWQFIGNFEVQLFKVRTVQCAMYGIDMAKTIRKPKARQFLGPDIVISCRTHESNLLSWPAC